MNRIRCRGKNVKASNLGSRSIIVSTAIVIIIVTTVLAMQVYKYNQNMICHSDSCYSLSQNLRYLLNTSIHPCNDFYGYVCNNWIRDNPVPAGRPTWSLMSQMRMNNLDSIFHSLKGQQNNFTLTERAASTYFRSCMNDAKTQPRGLRAFYKRFEDCVGISFTDWTSRSDKFRNIPLKDVMDRVMIQCKYQPLFGIFIHSDDSNSSNMAIYLERPVLLFGVKEFYQSNFENYRKVFGDVIQNIIDLMFPFEAYNITDVVYNITDFDRRVADSYTSMSESREVRYLRKVPISNLSHETQSFMDFKAYVNGYISPSNRTLVDSDRVSVTHEKSLSNIVKVFSNAVQTEGGERLILDYICLKLLTSYIDFMPEHIQTAMLPFRNITIGLSKYPERWETCVIQTRQAVPHGTARLFIRNSFNPEIRTILGDVYNSLKTEFRKRIKSRTWLDDSTMENALTKLDNMQAWFGYPDLLLNQSVIDAKYEDINFTDDDFFENFLKIKVKSLIERGKAFGKPRDKNDYGADVDEENASYDHSMNKIRVYAGILMPPGFQLYWPPAMTYGSIGYVIGHELTHGFDDQGRMFDGQGNQRNWWDDYAEEQFHSLSKCFVDQYSDFKVDNLTLNGDLTLGENIADNGGLRLAYNAYKTIYAHEKRHIRLPYLNLTPKQLFFISFALYWCESSTPQATEYYLLKDFHALPRFRVQGTIQNMPEFFEAFKCSAQQPLDKYRCELW